MVLEAHHLYEFNAYLFHLPHVSVGENAKHLDRHLPVAVHS